MRRVRAVAVDGDEREARAVGPLTFWWSLTLFCCALVAGLTLTHVLQSTGSHTLSAAEWLDVQHTFYGGFAIVGGSAEIVGLVSASFLTFRLRQGGRSFLGPAVVALCIAGMLVTFAVGNLPVNSLVATWTADTVPANWAAFRDRWELAHAISAALGLIALLVIIVSCTRRLPSSRPEST